MSDQIGCFPGMTRREYLSIDAVNISTLLEGRKTMAHLRYAMDHYKESTDAMRIGIALHIAVFEPSEFDKRVIYFPHPSCEAKVRRGKEWEKFEEAHRHKTILLADQLADVIAMRDCLLKFDPLKKLLASKGTGEMALVWKDEETGLLCKGMIDRDCQWNGWETIIDLKSCEDADKKSFARTIGNYGYHARAAWYLDGMNAIKPKDRRFFFILVEKSAPHLCNWFDAHDENDALVNEGRKLYRRILNQYAQAVKTREWAGYPITDSPEMISLNKWDCE